MAKYSQLHRDNLKRKEEGAMPLLANDLRAGQYAPPWMSDAQMRGIEYKISIAPGVTDFAKTVLIWLFRRTLHLTRPVALSLWNAGPLYSGRAAEVQRGVSAILDGEGKTDIDEFLAKLGTEMTLSHRQGCFVQDGDIDIFRRGAAGSTIWVSFIMYDLNAAALAPPMPDELAEIALVYMLAIGNEGK